MGEGAGEGNFRKKMILFLSNGKEVLLLHRVSPVRPAPAEFPQGRKAARVGGRSGATQVAYPFFMPFFVTFSLIPAFSLFPSPCLSGLPCTGSFSRAGFRPLYLRSEQPVIRHFWRCSGQP